jgi:hypothetical protein
VHRAYAKRALVKVPSLEEYERQPEKGKIVAFTLAAGVDSDNTVAPANQNGLRDAARG